MKTYYRLAQGDELYQKFNYVYFAEEEYARKIAEEENSRQHLYLSLNNINPPKVTVVERKEVLTDNFVLVSRYQNEITQILCDSGVMSRVVKNYDRCFLAENGTVSCFFDNGVPYVFGEDDLINDKFFFSHVLGKRADRFDIVGYVKLAMYIFQKHGLVDMQEYINCF